ncbi:DUF6380 family protein [Streptomyces sp. NPDC051684]|uniref:DUF6380 family protein n=1 Tax=Streptomyces sp. NPDC051684 TaxID=3365670 RepID=UPI00378AAF44
MDTAGQGDMARTKRRATLRRGAASLHATVGRVFATTVESGPTRAVRTTEGTTQGEGA